MSKPRTEPTKPAPPAAGLPPCAACRWAVPTAGLLRCHANPPQIRVPYDNVSAWPVVPDKGGGCRLHEARPE